MATTSTEEALDILRGNEPVDIVLLDVQMPGINGFEAIPLIREIDAHRMTPIIMLTGDSSHESHHRGLLLGASDYVFKPVSPDILRLRLKLHGENAQMRVQLEQLASTDTLTNLLNRRGLNDALERELARCRRSSLPISLTIIDIDHFKQVNDRYGHASGDSVLKTVARLLSAHFKRATDTVARLGGEEFVIACSDLDSEEFLDRLQSCRDVIKTTLFDVESSDSIHVTVSAGATTLVPEEEPHFLMARMLGVADQNLYKAKETRDTQVWSTG